MREKRMPDIGLMKDEYDRVPRPKKLSDVPKYMKALLGGFFKRLAYIIKLVWETGPWILIFMMLFSVITGVLPIVGSLISKEILNELQKVISEKAVLESTGIVYGAAFLGSVLMILIVCFFIYRILNQVISRLNIAVTRIAGEKIVRHVKTKIMNKAKEIDIASFDRPEFYEKLENANREAGNRPISVLSSTFSAISTFITLVSYIAVLFTAPGMWWIAPIMIVMSIPTAAVSFYYRKKTVTYMRRRSKDRRQMNYYSDIMVNKDMVKEIRMYELGDTFVDTYNDVFERYYRGIKKLILKENILLVIITIISSTLNCVFFALIAYHVFTGELQIGDYSLYTTALTSISANISSLIAVSSGVYEGTLFIDNLISFMNEKSTVVPSNSKTEKIAVGCPHSIEFKNVSFSYPESNVKVLDNINLTIRPGETAVLVGLNGAGKTTFIKLLTRLYDPTEGRILLDGKDLKEYDPNELYRIFGIIFQDFGKYAFSVSDNIRFGDIYRDADENEIEKAAKQANADDFIDSLSNGYDTPLMRIFEQEGTELSIGQWQKLAVARAFYSRSDILILDEPTASLDPIAEQEIFKQFDELRKEKTTIFVSHRLSSATTASKIIVLERGRLVEEGTHKELMAMRGRYYELFSTQAARYVSESN